MDKVPLERLVVLDGKVLQQEQEHPGLGASPAAACKMNPLPHPWLKPASPVHCPPRGAWMWVLQAPP